MYISYQIIDLNNIYDKNHCLLTFYIDLIDYYNYYLNYIYQHYKNHVQHYTLKDLLIEEVILAVVAIMKKNLFLFLY